MMAGRILAATAWLVASATVLIVAASQLCPNGRCRLPQIDTAGLALVNGWRSNGLDTFFSTITWLGSLWLLFPLAALIAWTQSRRSARRASAFVPLSLLLATTLSYFTKIMIERPRPEIFSAPGPLPTDWSFPSAHTMQVTAFLLALLLLSKDKFFIATATGVMLSILMVSTSRLYLQVHFPTDVIFGFMAAIGCVMAARQLTVEEGKLQGKLHEA